MKYTFTFKYSCMCHKKQVIWNFYQVTLGRSSICLTKLDAIAPVAKLEIKLNLGLKSHNYFRFDSQNKS